MVHPPIVTVRDGDDVEDAYLEMNEDVFHRLALEVSGQGIDLFAVRERIAREEPWLFERHRERLRAVRKGHFIAVRPETTKADVIAAFDLIKRELPSEGSTRRRSAKTKSDPLTCVQCAVWYDECGKTHGDIAARFGWELQHDRTLNQWSETARAHIARGRKILRSDPETRQSMILGQK